MLKIENFTGKRPDAVKQEVYTTLAFSNIVSIFKSFVDEKIAMDTENKGNKLTYQANRD